MTLARIHKHAGNLQKAMEKMDEARLLDTKDRYINTKCAKYQLRNDCNEDALKTMSLFTRVRNRSSQNPHQTANSAQNDAHGGPLGDLLEMQCVWFITEDGESYLRQGKFGLALKRFHAIWKIFDDWTEDQFDFHSFSLRKGQIRSYVNMLRWEDTLRAHPFFTRAALGAVKAYTMLFDKPHLAHSSLSNGGGTEGVDFEGLSTADRKKALKKAKREAQRAQEKAVEAAAKAKEEKAKNAQVANVEDEKKKEDSDPLGSELAQTKTPLDTAVKFLGPLLELSPRRVDVQCAGFEVYFRRRKWLLAVRCLRAAKEIDPENAVVHEQIVKFRTAGMFFCLEWWRVKRLMLVCSVWKLSDEDIKAPSKEVLTTTLEEIIPADTNLEAYNAEFLDRHRDSAKHVRGGKPHVIYPNVHNLHTKVHSTPNTPLPQFRRLTPHIPLRYPIPR